MWWVVGWMEGVGCMCGLNVCVPGRPGAGFGWMDGARHKEFYLLTTFFDNPQPLLLCQVGSAYAPSAWRAIREHLADILGKQCLELGDTPGALRHTGQLLLLAAQAGRSAAVQAQHWEQYKGLMKRVAAQQVREGWVQESGKHIVGGRYHGADHAMAVLAGMMSVMHVQPVCMWCL